MKNRVDVDNQELLKVTGLIQSFNEKMLSLKDIGKQIIEDDLIADVSSSISLLEWSRGYLEILVKNPLLIKSYFTSKPKVNLGKILDCGELLKFYNKNSQQKSHSGVVELEQIVAVTDKVFEKCEESIKNLENLTQPKI